MSPIRPWWAEQTLRSARTCHPSRSRDRKPGPCRAQASRPAAGRRARRVELAAPLAFGRGELSEEVLVDPAEDVARLVLGIAEADRADQVDQLAQALFVEPRPVVVLGQHALERRVVALDRDHRIVDQLADRGLLGVRLEERPARFLRHPEDVQGAVLVRILRIGALVALGLELGVLRLEGVRDVLQEDQAEHDVLVLGRVHVAPRSLSAAAQSFRSALSLGRYRRPLSSRAVLPCVICRPVALIGSHG